MTYSCTTITLRLYDYRCYSCTTIALQSYNYRGYSRTTIDFSFFENQVIWSLNFLIALFLSLDWLVINTKNPVINRLVKPTERWLDCQLAPISWSTHAQQVLCERISAVMQAHNSCCAAYGVNFSDNLYYLFRQLHLSFPTTSSVFCDSFNRILRFL